MNLWRLDRKGASEDEIGLVLLEIATLPALSIYSNFFWFSHCLHLSLLFLPSPQYRNTNPKMSQKSHDSPPQLFLSCLPTQSQPMRSSALAMREFIPQRNSLTMILVTSTGFFWPIRCALSLHNWLVAFWRGLPLTYEFSRRSAVKIQIIDQISSEWNRVLSWSASMQSMWKSIYWNQLEKFGLAFFKLSSACYYCLLQ